MMIGWRLHRAGMWGCAKGKQGLMVGAAGCVCECTHVSAGR